MPAKDLKSAVRAAIAAIMCVALTALGAPAFAAGQLIADGGFGGVLETKEHDVRVVINNGVAVTEVEQVFVNKENRIVEALYVFPVPKNASVANFSMWIGGREMIGEVVEKERAREIYNSYKQVKRDPGLLEQVDYKRFEMRIFPIPARAEQRVKVTYYQELEFDHDWATYVYPLATTVENGRVNERTTGRFSLSLEAKSEVPIVQMESPSHGKEFVIAKHSDLYSQASLEVDGGDLGRDVVLSYKLERPRSGVDVITSKEANDDGYFMMTITASKELEQQEKGMDYVFLLDVSGSMAALMLRPIGTLSMLGLMLHGAMGRLGEAAGVESFEFRHMVVRPRLPPGRKEIAVAFDGEVARMRVPINIRVLDKPLYLLQATGAAGAANMPEAAP